MAVGQPDYLLLIHRIREQARSHIFELCRVEILRQAQIRVGAGLPAMAVGQPDYLLLIHRIRGQARSHIWDCGGWEFCVRHKSVWELACLRWRWVSQIICWRYTAFAGKPAPTFGTGAGGNFASGTNQCGSWLACDGGGSAKLFAADTPHSRASPLPHF